MMEINFHKLCVFHIGEEQIILTYGIKALSIWSNKMRCYFYCIVGGRCIPFTYFYDYCVLFCVLNLIKYILV